MTWLMPKYQTFIFFCLRWNLIKNILGCQNFKYSAVGKIQHLEVLIGLVWIWKFEIWKDFRFVLLSIILFPT